MRILPVILSSLFVMAVTLPGAAGDSIILPDRSLNYPTFESFCLPRAKVPIWKLGPEILEPSAPQTAHDSGGHSLVACQLPTQETGKLYSGAKEDYDMLVTCLDFFIEEV